MIKVITKLVVMITLSLSLAGCGNTTTCNSAPDGSTIDINPPGEVITDSSGTVRTLTEYFTITVTNGGTPLNNVRVNIHYDWAVPSAASVVQLYDGSTPVNSPFDACTDAFGTYTLRFDYDSGGGYEYIGDLDLRSGSAFQSVTFEVKS